MTVVLTCFHRGILTRRWQLRRRRRRRRRRRGWQRSPSRGRRAFGVRHRDLDLFLALLVLARRLFRARACPYASSSRLLIFGIRPR